MNMLSKLTVVGALAANVALAGTAAATTYTATYTGIVEGTDTDGLFSAPNTNLNGVPFTAVFTYNPALFGAGTRTTTAGVSDEAVGGSADTTTSPILSDLLTINSVSLSVDVSQVSIAEATTNELAEAAEDLINGREFVAGFMDPSVSVIPDLGATQSYSGFLAYELANGVQGALLYGDDELSLYANTASISASASVPEPGSLALMATAVGLLGFAVRRRSA
jgi:PEP-CTERM motif